MIDKAVLLTPTAPEQETGPRRARFAHESSDRLALFPIANRPFIFHALDRLREAGIRRVGVVSPAGGGLELRAALGSGGEWDLELDWIEQASEGRMAAAEAYVDGEPFLLHLGDSLARTTLRPMTDSEPRGLDTRVLVRDDETADERPSVVELAAKRFGGRHQAGVYAFGPEILEHAHGLSPQPNCERELRAVLDRLAERGGRCDAVPVRDWWRYGRGPDALLEANRFALEGLRADYRGATIANSRVQGGAVIDPTAQIESSIVRGPVIIGPNTVLRDAYVGPYTSIGENVMIEGAEIENSVILPGASVSHLGGRLESSLVGAGSRVYRDFRLPRAMRVNVGEGAEVALA